MEVAMLVTVYKVIVCFLLQNEVELYRNELL